MFYPVQPTLSGALATNGTLSIPGVDAYRLKVGGPHTLSLSGTIYRAPTDFTIAVDGLNTVTLTWLNAATLASGSKPAIFLAVIDTITDAAEGSSADPISAKISSVAGTAYVNVSVASLSAGQAAGTSTVLAANANRRSLMINPPVDCFIAITSGATVGWPLFGGVPNTITGQECPTNALYVDGLSAGATLTIWEG